MKKHLRLQVLFSLNRDWKLGKFYAGGQIQKRLTLFFDTVGAKKKLCKKKRRFRISPSAEGDQRSTALDPCHLLKKVDEKFLTWDR